MAVGDVPSQARIRPSLKQASANIWPNIWWLLLFGFLAALAQGIEGSQEAAPAGVVLTVNVVGGLVALFVGIPLSMGLTKAHLAASRGLKPTWQDFGYSFGPRYWPTIGLGVLTMLIVVGGLILLIIPGIYWGVRLAFAQQRFIEDELGVMDAIRASRADVTGRWWNVFGLILMAILLVLAGLLALVVGVFVSLVLIQQMVTVYWRAIQAERGAWTKQSGH